MAIGGYMTYNMTEQYARGEEKPIASFNELNDATNFMAKKSSIDEGERKKAIYRLYDDTDLLQQLNRDGIITSNAAYADGNRDFDTMPPFACKVMFQLVDTTERKSIASFNDKNNAKLFVINKCGVDHPTSDNDLFFIYQNNNLIDTLNKIIIGHQKKKTEGSSSSGKEKGATFRPSPLPTRPVPPGGPTDCWDENEDDK
jgi:hypothetical protein